MRNKHICGQKSVRGMVWFDEWNIGLVQQEIGEVLRDGLRQVAWMKHDYRDRWFADPFLLSVTQGEVVLLAEEFRKDKQRGCISKLTIDKRTMELIERRVILEEGMVHFSFPYMVRKEGKVLILPEKGKTGEWDAYLYDEEKECCRKMACWCERPLADAVLIDDETMMATELPEPDGKVLNIYERKEGRFEKAYTVTFAENIARNGGSLFEVEGALYRPAQVSEKRYGEGVSIQRMDKVGGQWTFEEVRRLYPQDKRYNKGMHTFQVWPQENLIVVDGLRYRLANAFYR